MPHKTMDCKRIDELLVDYLYQELETTERKGFEAHLESCAGCREDLRSFEHTREMMQGLEEVEPPAALDDLLRQEAERQVPREAGLLERLRQGLRVLVMHPGLAAAATLVVVLGISFLVYRQGVPPAQKAPRSDLPVDEDHRATIGLAPGSSTVAPATAEAKAEDEPLAGRAALPAGRAAPMEQERALRDKDLQVAGPERKRLAGRMRAARRADRSRGGELAGGKLGNLREGDAFKEGEGVADDRVANEKDLAVAKKSPKRKARKMAPRRPATREAQVKGNQEYSKQQGQPSQLRGRFRRQAQNVSDTGGGSGGVWADKSRSKYRAGVASGANAAPQAASPMKVSAQPAKEPKGKAGKAGKADPVRALLVAAASAVRARRCNEAFALYNRALTQRPRVIGVVLNGIGPCVGKLQKSTQYRSLARRLDKERSRQTMRARRSRAKSAKPAQPAQAVDQAVQAK